MKLRPGLSRNSYPLWLAAVGFLSWQTTASASDLTVCIDSSSPAAAMDHKLAEAVARDQNAGLVVHEFDGKGDDDGYDLKNFISLVDHQCQLVLGYPVDTTSAPLPSGLLATKPYGRIGFVLVTPRAEPADDLAALPKGTDVAVTYLTMPNLYFVNHANVEADIYQTDADTIATLANHKVRAAMVWRPTLINYLVTHKKESDFSYHELNEPHATMGVVALYGVGGAQAAARFENSIVALRGSGDLRRVLEPYATVSPQPVVLAAADVITPAPAAGAAQGETPPALYAADQAIAGKQKFAENCSQCHGDNLEGQSGPALKGKLFASAKAGFHVADIFTIVSQNMPSTQPGSLAHDDYVQIMAYLLQQNGYPAGSTPLTFSDAMASKTPLIYNGQ